MDGRISSFRRFHANENFVAQRLTPFWERFSS
jgi:hypothetical protein